MALQQRWQRSLRPGRACLLCPLVLLLHNASGALAAEEEARVSRSTKGNLTFVISPESGCPMLQEAPKRYSVGSVKSGWMPWDRHSVKAGRTEIGTASRRWRRFAHEWELRTPSGELWGLARRGFWSSTLEMFDCRGERVARLRADWDWHGRTKAGVVADPADRTLATIRADPSKIDAARYSAHHFWGNGRGLARLLHRRTNGESTTTVTILESRGEEAFWNNNPHMMSLLVVASWTGAPQLRLFAAAVFAFVVASAALAALAALAAAGVSRHVGEARKETLLELPAPAVASRPSGDRTSIMKSLSGNLRPRTPPSATLSSSR